ncbi:helix-turn-helix transcriptional regulator [Corynebacterium sp. MSK039]|uniref:heat shock protein transcriptional repressor HspR n=1 Tax=Corynebacterium sp. MSK039 TaxID=3050193 RepID=UPI00254FF3B1|nr:helix-turn-helix transcriptional regulator [Corynebacterium sp. MSK039]MDK8791198.1 helix-turn-helix transcriptional regulator [Corynebacterium sp. MSK039]
MSEASKKQGPNEQAGPEAGTAGTHGKGEEQEQEVFVISVAAEITGMHAQTLRTYDRMGLVTPQRTRGGGRRYSRDDIAQLLEIQRLSHEEGVNLAGIQRIIELEERLQAAQQENAVLRQQLANARGESRGRSRGEIVHVPRSTAVVLWEQRRKR